MFVELFSSQTGCVVDGRYLPSAEYVPFQIAEDDISCRSLDYLEYAAPSCIALRKEVFRGVVLPSTWCW